MFNINTANIFLNEGYDTLKEKFEIFLKATVPKSKGFLFDGIDTDDAENMNTFVANFTLKGHDANLVFDVDRSKAKAKVILGMTGKKSTNYVLGSYYVWAAKDIEDLLYDNKFVALINQKITEYNNT